MRIFNKASTLIIACSLSVSAFGSSLPDVQEIAEISWCPQICPNNSEHPGYISEILNETINGLGTKFIRNEYPWSRAINNVVQGKSIALSAPAKQEAPNLIYPSIPIGIQRMCFFVNQQSNWAYTGVESLRGVIVGIASDTSIEELNQYVKSYPENFQYQPYHDRFISQNVKKLNKGRIDTFIFTRNSTLYKLKKLGLHDEVKIAGCVSSAPVYIAFSPAEQKRDLSIALADLFDQRMLQLIKENKVNSILGKYQVGFNAQDLLRYRNSN